MSERNNEILRGEHGENESTSQSCPETDYHVSKCDFSKKVSGKTSADRETSN